MKNKLFPSLLVLLAFIQLAFPVLAAHVTVPAIDARVQYTVGGTPDATFTIPFTFYDETGDIVVYDDGVLVDPNDYSVAGNAGTTGGFEGGVVTLDTAVTNSTITLLLDIPLERTTDFPNSSDFNITSLNTQFDRLVSMAQLLQDKFSRSLHLDDSLDDDIELLLLEAPEDGASLIYDEEEGGYVNTASLTNLSEDVDDISDSVTAAAASASAAADSATASAASAASLYGSSTSSVLIGTGSKSFTTQSGKFFNVGNFILIASDADESNYMHGQVTAYSGTSLTVNVITTGGTGTFADWVITVSGVKGATGPTGPTGPAGAGSGDMLIANNLSELTATASTARTNIGLGTIATQNANGVTISGGAITGITDLAIADGGTGASSAAAAFTNLKQAATESATGVCELATTAEATTGSDTTRCVTPAGVSAAIAAGAGGGDWTLIKTKTASSDATIDFTNGVSDVVLDSTYKVYALVLTNVVFSQDTTLLARTSSNAGSSFDSGASDYGSGTTEISPDGASAFSDNAEAQMKMTGSSVGGAAGESLSGIIYLHSPAATTKFLIDYTLTYIQATGSPVSLRGSHVRHASADVDGFRLYPQDGTFASGTFSLYALTP